MLRFGFSRSLALFAFTIAAPSQTYALSFWTGGTDDWFNASNWSHIVPDYNEDARINNGGTAVISGGTAFASAVTMGYAAGDSGTLLIRDGASLTSTSDFYVGSSGSGTLNILSGGSAANRLSYIGFNTASHGAVTVDGVGSVWTSDINVGYYGVGTLAITNGGIVRGSGTLGYQAGNGSVVIEGAGSAWIGSSLRVGYDGVGRVDVFNGGAVSTDFGSVGTGSAIATAVISGSGSSWTSVYSLQVGGRGVLRVENGASINATNTVISGVGALEFDSSSTINTTITSNYGGILRPLGALNITSAIGIVGYFFLDSNGFDSTFSGTISGVGDIYKIGAGTITLNSPVTLSFFDRTFVNGGTFVVNSSLSTRVFVNPNCVLGGSGVVGGVTINPTGVLSPGSGVGILTVNGNLTLGLGAIYLVDVNGAAVGVGYDQTKVNGLVTIDGARLSLRLGFVPSLGTEFVLLDNDATDPVVGTFEGLLEGELFTVNGQQFAISYHGGDGNDVVVRAVPEPRAAALLVFGTSIVAILNARRKSRSLLEPL